MPEIKNIYKKTADFLKAGFGTAEIWICLLIIFYAAAGALLAASVGQTINFKLFLYSGLIWRTSLCVATTFMTARILYVMIVRRPARLTAFLVQDFKNFLMTENRLARALPLFLCFIVFVSVFTSLKTLIPVVHPFSWDTRLAELDRLVHGGVDPWQHLQPLLGYPFVTAAVNMVYNLWFFTMFSILYWQLFSVSRPRLRLLFFYTFFLAWILNGTVLAMIFSSAGPCFYQLLTGSDYYEPLMSYLRHAAETGPVYAIETQNMLWRASKETGIGSGISAMSSVHVAAAFIFMMLGWETSRRLGILLTVFFVLILAGSVHLGWHYAMDGYVAIITSALIWALVRHLLPGDLQAAEKPDLATQTL